MNDDEAEQQAEQDDSPLTNGDNGLAETRDGKGRFLPGNPGGPGNPQARSVAAWRRALADSICDEDVAQVTLKLLDAAKAGEPWAVREFYDRCLGKPSVQIGIQADVEPIRQLNGREQREARRIAKFLLEHPAERDEPQQDH